MSATMNTMSYKGFTVEVEYDGVDRMLVGRVAGLRHAIIDCMGESVGEFEQDFHNAVDHYLEICAEKGSAPEQPVEL